MSRALVLIAMALATLCSCVDSRPQAISAPPPPNPDVLAYRTLREWLDVEQTVAIMDIEQVTAALVKTGRPKSYREKFYYGLLNQKLNNMSSWTHARDTFLELSETPELTDDQRQLASILARYNESRINWYSEYQEARDDFASTQAELEAVRQENSLLRQKIQAITELETSISTRKEPTQDEQ